VYQVKKFIPWHCFNLNEQANCLAAYQHNSVINSKENDVDMLFEIISPGQQRWYGAKFTKIRNCTEDEQTSPHRQTTVALFTYDKQRFNPDLFWYNSEECWEVNSGVLATKNRSILEWNFEIMEWNFVLSGIHYLHVMLDTMMIHSHQNRQVVIGKQQLVKLH
jgi:hypothetical protein